MVKHKKFLIGYKLLFGSLGASAIVTELLVLMQRGTFAPANFFSFFTIESNMFAVAVLLYGAARLMWSNHTPRFDMIRGAAALYMAMTGVIFAALLSGLDADTLTAVPWDNTVLHYIMPLAVFGDWLLDPPTRRISFKKALIWLAYPIGYIVYTLVRGTIVNWYPYPFLNANDSSYSSIAIVILGITVLVCGFVWLITRVRRTTISA
jgi:hypothetical protein